MIIAIVGREVDLRGCRVQHRVGSTSIPQFVPLVLRCADFVLLDHDANAADEAYARSMVRYSENPRIYREVKPLVIDGKA